MKSWKTTLAGALAALGTWASAQPDPWWLWKLGQAMNVLGLFLLGATARDNNVPSAAIPSAAREEAKIKGDTAFTPKP